MPALPDPLVTENGDPVRDAETWRRVRRPEILGLFETQVYGRAPGPPARLDVQIVEAPVPVMDGRAERRQVVLTVGDDDQSIDMHVLVYVPSQRDGPVPVFAGLNFGGNHTVQPDAEIRLPTAWVRNRPDQGVADHRASESSRGASAGRWPVDRIIERGYALVTCYYGDIDPDFDDGFENGIHAVYGQPGGQPPAPDAWGSIAAWAWGLSRMLDYAELAGDLDPQRVIAIGHSRLGKTALWAAARDERFAMAVSNNSGCGGAALSRRRSGETVARINQSFPHWFCDTFTQYNDAEDALPVDQHQLIALIAPRPVYVASATEDAWADPLGEFLSAVHAEPVYRLLGRVGVGTDRPPPPDRPIGDTVGYHLRSGGHDITPYDWDQYLDFADRHL